MEKIKKPFFRAENFILEYHLFNAKNQKRRRDI